MRTRFIAAGLFVIAVGFSGCSGNREPTTTITEKPSATENAVTVELSEMKIEMPASIPAGPTTFQIRNTGSMEHNFEIEGNGMERELDQNLKAGESGTLQVDLAPGTYKVYCPVGEHAPKGMTMQLTVN
ncbi:MAG: cupredoxin domain-containing protein [Bryobacteraceae bacterium]